ncbi:hypothetical protein Neosp_007277 [[Neocosmospora] mangrovei]
MITLLSPHYKAQEVTETDLVIASLAWGFTIGFGWLTTWTAVKQTTQVYRRHGRRVWKNAYVWMIWLELLVCLIFAIIVNRCSILLTDKRKAYRLKVGVAVLITAVNISVYNIWIPARLQISERYIWINEWWDRCEKVIYLLVDASLNLYFIHVVRVNLIVHGLTKYKRLTHFNMFIIGFSLSMDVLIITMMSLKNTFVYVIATGFASDRLLLTPLRYMQFHPLAYTVKLNIEMSMADLIGKIARDKHCGVISEGTFSSTISDGQYHLESLDQRSTTDSQRRLSGRDEFGFVSKPRRILHCCTRRTGEYHREVPEEFPEP